MSDYLQLQNIPLLKHCASTLLFKRRHKFLIKIWIPFFQLFLNGYQLKPAAMIENVKYWTSSKFLERKYENT